jgi:energy-coupling factor transport system substrate-specific component
VLQRWLQDRRARFLLAGGLAALLNWLVRFPLNLAMPYAAAVVLATAIGMVFGFLLYRAWVFPGSSRDTLLQIRDFVLVNLAGMAVTVGVAVTLRHALLTLDIPGELAAAVAHAAGIGAGAVANYLGHRDLTFR